MTEIARAQYAGMRSILEVPILNDRYWSKVPDSPADAIMIDLEDSATPGTKSEVRARMVEAVADIGYFGGRRVIVRINNIRTPWAVDDFEAVAELPDDVLICYPKVESAEELRDVRQRLESLGRPGKLYVMIETARALIELRDIASSEGVVGLHFGYVDFAANVGTQPFDDTGTDLYGHANCYARSKIAIAAAAYGLFCTAGTLIPDYRNLQSVRIFIEKWPKLGYTALIAVTPAHLHIVNEVMTPGGDQVAEALKICEAYESSVRQGLPAVVLDGRVVTMPDYRAASVLLVRAGIDRPTVAPRP